MRSNELGADAGASQNRDAAATAGGQESAAGKVPVIDSQWQLKPDLSDRALRDQINHSLFQDSIPPNFRLQPNPKVFGPQTQSLDLNQPILRPETTYSIKGANDEANRKQLDEDARRYLRESEMIGPTRNLPGMRKSDVYTESRQRFSDQVADNIFPGFGRIESKDPQNPWRLDYIYSNRCRVKGLGLCFSMKMK